MTELLPGHRIIEQVAVGTLNDPEVFELILGVQQLQQETGIGDTLLDCTGLTQGTASVPVLDLIDRVVGIGMEPGWRQAIIRPHEAFAAMTVDRWMAAANNRGVTVRVFRDREAALEWLTAG
jgi:hypothetical protein